MTRWHPLRASHRLWPAGALLLVFAMATPVYCQRDPFNSAGSTTSTIPGYESHVGTMALITVYAESTSTKLDRQSLVKLTNLNTQVVNWQTTTDASEANFGDLPFGHYEVEVSAVGYLAGHKQFQVVSSLVPIKL